MCRMKRYAYVAYVVKQCITEYYKQQYSENSLYSGNRQSSLKRNTIIIIIIFLLSLTMDCMTNVYGIKSWILIYNEFLENSSKFSTFSDQLINSLHYYVSNVYSS